jgi:hypothetical protein
MDASRPEAGNCNSLSGFAAKVFSGAYDGRIRDR